MSEFTVVTKKTSKSSSSSSKHRIKSSTKPRSLLSTQTSSSKTTLDEDVKMDDEAEGDAREKDGVELGEDEVNEMFEIFGKRVSLLGSGSEKSNLAKTPVPSFPSESMDADSLSSSEDEDLTLTTPSLPPSTTTVAPSSTSAISFPAISHTSSTNLTQRAKLSIPPHRMTPLKREWEKIYRPLVEELGLGVRVVPGKRRVELKTTKHSSPSSLSKATDFLTAFFLGFTPEDSLALLRLDDLYIESFEIRDVKQVLHADHLSRAIGRIVGKDGKTRFAIENASRTRIVVADHIKIARDAVCALILGSPPGKVYANLRNVAARQKMRG